MCVQYIWGISWVYRGVFSTSGDIMSTSVGYHEYIGGISWVHRGVFSTSRGYHEYIGGCSVHQGFQYKLKDFCHLAPHMHHGIPPMYSWYPRDVLMVSLRCTPDVLNIPRCTEHTLKRAMTVNNWPLTVLKRRPFYKELQYRLSNLLVCNTYLCDLDMWNGNLVSQKSTLVRQRIKQKSFVLLFKQL